MATYIGSTETERLESAIHYDRLIGLIERMQRSGFVVTSGEVETIQYVMSKFVIPEEPEPPTQPQSATQQEPAQKRGRQLRPIE
ncbi:MAG TPA: hypothetical protein PK445_10130 [Methanolinea sp.]|nr:hypothetical protein [Methanolinea sp.]